MVFFLVVDLAEGILSSLTFSAIVALFFLVVFFLVVGAAEETLSSLGISTAFLLVVFFLVVFFLVVGAAETFSAFSIISSAASRSFLEGLTFLRLGFG